MYAISPSAVLTYWKYNNIPNIEKETEQTWTDRYDRLRLFPSLSLDSPSVATSIMYVIFMIIISFKCKWIMI